MTRIDWAVFAEGVLFDPTKAFMVKASAQEKVISKSYKAVESMLRLWRDLTIASDF
jgi:hypothetical protein